MWPLASPSAPRVNDLITSVRLRRRSFFSGSAHTAVGGLSLLPMPFSHKTVRAACAVAVGALLFAGCGSSGPAPSSQSATSAGQSTTDAGASSTAQGHSSTSGSSTSKSVVDPPGSSASSGARPAVTQVSRSSSGAGSANGRGSAGKGGSKGGGTAPAERRTHPGAGSSGQSHVGAGPNVPASGANVPNSENGVPFEVKTASMKPTYKPFTTVYYDPTRTHPQLGQVMAFYLPIGVRDGRCATPEIGGVACAVAVPGLTKTLSISRVVGLPGDRIAIVNGHVVRNDQAISEPNIETCGVAEEQYEPGCQYPKPLTVPPESYYVLSDYRSLWQVDSRNYGAVPQGAVVGTLLGS